jgi:hypothetical protein
MCMCVTKGRIGGGRLACVTVCALPTDWKEIGFDLDEVLAAEEASKKKDADGKKK